ncbi:UNVERIFIED_ORG: hypothetical protein J2Y81_007204 [Paraburkholderia sediminicola]|nr:hypothetical protein [Paraburkholderia sediminicola]
MFTIVSGWWGYQLANKTTFRLTAPRSPCDLGATVHLPTKLTLWARHKANRRSKGL